MRFNHFLNRVNTVEKRKERICSDCGTTFHSFNTVSYHRKITGHKIPIIGKNILGFCPHEIIKKKKIVIEEAD